MKKKVKNDCSSYFKMSGEELQAYISSFRNRTFAKKKGDGSYTRKVKHKNKEED